MRGYRRLAGGLVGTIILSLLLAYQPVAALGPSGPSTSKTVGSRITNPLPLVADARRNPLAEGAGQSWKALNQAAYESAKTAANAAATEATAMVAATQ